MAKGSAVDLPPKKPVSAIEERFALAGAIDLRNAWDRAAQIAPDAALDEPREACARFLKAEPGAFAPDIAITELAVLIRKHVPGLVTETSRILDLTDDTKAEDAIRIMLDELRALGDEAKGAIEAMQLRAQEKLLVRRSRLSRRRADGAVFS